MFNASYAKSWENEKGSNAEVRSMAINQPQSAVSMTNKRIIVTGPTSGFGREIAMRLALLGAEVVLACRDLERGERVAEEIAARTGRKDCTVLRIDTSSRQSILEFAQQFSKKFSRLDVLVNNAGILRSKRQASVDGIELTFATNVLGYWLLTQELLDLLKASAPARIVNVASTYAGELDLTDLQFELRTYDGQKAYKQSKACNRMLTWAFSRRLEGSGVAANAMAPGLVAKTGLYRSVGPAVQLLMHVLGLFFGRSTAQGADTAIWLASSPEVEGISGKFFDRRKEVPCSFRNREAEETLWRICEGLTG
jgi:NAD(P)-dependent dehydrogenase (short-subunit alcohol dehydrogenase family)